MSLHLTLAPKTLTVDSSSECFQFWDKFELNTLNLTYFMEACNSYLKPWVVQLIRVYLVKKSDIGDVMEKRMR